MGCGCNNGPITSWLDIYTRMPSNPLEIIAYADIGGAVGTYANSSNYGTVGGAWVATPWTVNAEPTVQTLANDQFATIALANQWNLSHLGANLGATLPPPLRKVLFLRAGTMWVNTIPLQLGGATYDDLQLSFRDNAGTRGDAAGTVPVIGWSGSFTGINMLGITLHSPGEAIIGIRARHVATGDYSMFEMEWRIVS